MLSKYQRCSGVNPALTADFQQSDVTPKNRKLEWAKLFCKAQCKTELSLNKISRILLDLWDAGRI